MSLWPNGILRSRFFLPILHTHKLAFSFPKNGSMIADYSFSLSHCPPFFSPALAPVWSAQRFSRCQGQPFSDEKVRCPPTFAPYNSPPLPFLEALPSHSLTHSGTLLAYRFISCSRFPIISVLFLLRPFFFWECFPLQSFSPTTFCASGNLD